MKKLIIFFYLLLMYFCSLNLNAQTPGLLPLPQKVVWGKDKFQVEGAKIKISYDLLIREQKTIDKFIDLVKQNTGISLSTTYNEDTDSQLIVLNSDQQGPALPVPNEQSGNHSREAYRIKITSNRAEVSGKSDAGLFCALQTLGQLLMGDDKNGYFPGVDIEDYPAYAYRGVMMDFAHGGLLTEAEIKNQIEFLSRWKMNQYYFYNEVSIEMKGYPLINYNACYSQEQIKRIISFARERHIDVIPFVEFYGHLHELLRLEKYAGLGIGKYGHDVNPDNPGVQTLLKDWIRQYADIFPSPFIHVGFDETWETERLTAEDKSIKPKELYLKQLNFVAKTLQDYGKKVMVWTDISKNYPDIISEFPKEIIPVIWEYSDDPSAFPVWLTPIRKANLPFFVQSAVDSWGNVYPSADYTYDNIDLCLKTCRDEKAVGYITSVWTDAVQPLLRNTWLFMAYGSAGAWQKEPVDRNEFINNYCHNMFPRISGQMTNGYMKMAESENWLAKCLGRQTLQEMWANPFSSFHIKNTNTHINDYKNARIAAETALESFYEVLHTQKCDTAFIKTLLVNCRLLDYTASRFIWAKTIVDRWNWSYDFSMKGKKDYIMYYDINYSTHGLISDMMDYCTEIKEEYRKAWLSENMPYRMGTITGRFDSEYLLWRNIYSKIAEYRNHKKNNESRLKFEEFLLNNK